MSTAASWKVLVVDDQKTICEDLHEALHGFSPLDSGPRLHVETETSFDRAYARILSERFDLVILDVRKDTPEADTQAGSRIFENFKSHRFVPVIFYTALPRTVSDATGSFVAIVEKSEGTDAVIGKIKLIFSTMLPHLLRHIEEEQRKYLWVELPKLISQHKRPLDPAEPVYLLARRLAQKLSGESIRDFLKLPQDKVHPSEFYIFPPTHPDPLSGDIYQAPNTQPQDYWVTITPSCDLATRANGKCNAEFVLMAGTESLTTTSEHRAWQASKGKSSPDGSVGTREKLEKSITNNRSGGQASRYHFLPGIGGMPDLVVDFQNTRAVRYSELTSTWIRIASLDNPFAENLQNRFINHTGRVGAPDINPAAVLKRFS
ncbi:hypothetical protein HPC50_22770 [Corallococcus exiguus]|uniref:response regulator n=1 Tax=Corallococcus TaxID=83461 RepID=UPI0011C38712|nr:MULTISPECIES: response regulator [Corallococcus]NPC49885.1 hypothetical protein [Corallococcus exiguus]